MAKLKKQLKTQPRKGSPWMIEFKFGYNKDMLPIIKEYPGCSWDKVAKVWLVPIELAEKMKETFRKYGYEAS